MKVKWEDFAQRRKIDLEMFQHMSFLEYADWCKQRRVEPISEESYTGTQRILNSAFEPLPPATTKVDRQAYSYKDLRKLKKQDLTDLCESNSLDLNGAETKKKLIDLLLELNNNST